jgi:hypothetical protein
MNEWMENKKEVAKNTRNQLIVAGILLAAGGAWYVFTHH